MGIGSRSTIVYDSGYTVGFLAFKHTISLKDATDLLSEVGLSRDALDAAAKMLKERRKLGPHAA